MEKMHIRYKTPISMHTSNMTIYFEKTDEYMTHGIYFPPHLQTGWTTRNIKKKFKP